MAEIYRTLAFLPLDGVGDRRDPRPMKTAILIFPKLAALDAIGPYEVFRSVPGWEVSFVGLEKGTIRAEGGLGLSVDLTLEEVGEVDAVLVPGGEGNRPLLADERVLAWLREVDARTRWTISVCTGSLVLGAAGLLEGKRATGNWLFLDRLAEYGAEAVGGRYVEDGKLVTAAGVTAGLDMALHLVAREASPEVAQAVQLGLEYDPDPPFDSGSPEKASPAIVELVESVAGPNEDWAAAASERG
jgi:transcriptional regulator GlxA family with amidase domain